MVRNKAGNNSSFRRCIISKNNDHGGDSGHGDDGVEDNDDNTLLAD